VCPAFFAKTGKMGSGEKRPKLVAGGGDQILEGFADGFGGKECRHYRADYWPDLNDGERVAESAQRT
jgi:hypothetical protein